MNCNAVLVIGYSRPQALRRCVESLKNLSLTDEAVVVCVVDRSRNASDLALNNETRETALALKQEGLVFS